MVFSTSKVIDWELGSSLFGGDRQAAEEMLEQLCHELPAFKDQLLAACEKKDVKKLQEIAHKLYGGACYCPTPRLKEAVKNLENLLVDSSTDMKQHVSLVMTEIDEVFKYCQTEII